LREKYEKRPYKWKPEYPEKTTDLSQVTDKLYHVLYRGPQALVSFKKCMPPPLKYEKRPYKYKKYKTKTNKKQCSKFY
jgi:hypothetical protein